MERRENPGKAVPHSAALHAGYSPLSDDPLDGKLGAAYELCYPVVI